MLYRAKTTEDPPSTFARGRYFAAIALISLLLLVILAAILLHFRASSGPIAEKNRHPMPPLQLNLMDGGIWKLTDHRGQVVAINYWASWCEPCWQETPILVEIDREFAPKGFAIVGVAVDERNSNDVPQGVRHFVNALRVPYPIALVAPMSQMTYSMEGLPTTILIDRDGRIARTYVGAIRETIFQDDISALLDEPAPAPH
jgi:cytochrome c biogenesis protein CcmG/thiol:disulfide interchange protein DsbE